MIGPLLPDESWRAVAMCAGEPALALRSALCREPDGPGWRSLQQAWKGGQRDREFREGWARVRWNSAGLLYDAIFLGRGQRNRARLLNERTWELGEVCELFIHADGAPHYVEIHITPENQRMQLRLPLGAIDQVRAGRAALENFMIPDPAWVISRAACTNAGFYAQVWLPADLLGHGSCGLDPAVRVRSAVCRYDYSESADAPVLSTTAPLPSPAFHAPFLWSSLRLEKGE